MTLSGCICECKGLRTQTIYVSTCSHDVQPLFRVSRNGIVIPMAHGVDFWESADELA